MKFSVVIPTRNRPELLFDAVRSVLAQTSDDFELIVVKDGTVHEHVEAYGEVEVLCRKAIRERVKFICLPQRELGHGPAYSRNAGCAAARGDYLCFLDDDDSWIDDDYLRTVAGNIGETETPVDLHYAGQLAYLGGVKLSRRLWIEPVEDNLRRRHGELDPRRSYPVGVAELIATGSHAHLNTMAIRRDLFTALSGFDENLRYEEDKDLYIRAIDRAKHIRYMPAAVARHNVPDPARHASASAMSTFDKLIYQNRTIDKIILFGERPEVRAHGLQLKRFALKHLAEGLYREGRFREASFYARQALLIGFNVKWLAFTLWMGLRSLAGRRGKGSKPAAGSGDAPGESLQPACNSDEPSRTQPPREA